MLLTYLLSVFVLLPFYELFQVQPDPPKVKVFLGT